MTHSGFGQILGKSSSFLFQDGEINIDGLPHYRMGELADIEEIKFFIDSEDQS